MSAWTRRLPAATPATGSSTNTTVYNASPVTPSANVLLVVCIDMSGSNEPAPVLTSNANGLTFSLLDLQATNPTIDGHKSIWIADQLTPAVPVSMILSLSLTASGDAGTGCNFFILELSSMTRVGLDAVRTIGGVKQLYTGDENIAASSVPSGTLPDVPLTTNPILGFIGNVTGSASAITVPSGFTDLARLSYSTPTKGSYVHTRNSGQTAATITWGSNSSAGGLQIVEFDASAPPAAIDMRPGVPIK